jgi:hypothetical protein
MQRTPSRLICLICEFEELPEPIISVFYETILQALTSRTNDLNVLFSVIGVPSSFIIVITPLNETETQASDC